MSYLDRISISGEYKDELEKARCLGDKQIGVKFVAAEDEGFINMLFTDNMTAVSVEIEVEGEISEEVILDYKTFMNAMSICEEYGEVKNAVIVFEFNRETMVANMTVLKAVVGEDGDYTKVGEATENIKMIPNTGVKANILNRIDVKEDESYVSDIITKEEFSNIMGLGKEKGTIVYLSPVHGCFANNREHLSVVSNAGDRSMPIVIKSETLNIVKKLIGNIEDEIEIGVQKNSIFIKSEGMIVNTPLAEPSGLHIKALSIYRQKDYSVNLTLLKDLVKNSIGSEVIKINVKDGENIEIKGKQKYVLDNSYSSVTIGDKDIADVKEDISFRVNGSELYSIINKCRTPFIAIDINESAIRIAEIDIEKRAELVSELKMSKNISYEESLSVEEEVSLREGYLLDKHYMTASTSL